MDSDIMEKAEDTQSGERRRAPVSKACEECIGTARELLGVLTQEAEVLKRFAGGELPALLSKKEFLVNELGEKLSALHALRDAQGPETGASSPVLRRLIDGIRKRNESNGRFISSTLGYWQDFIAAVFPRNYGPSPDQAKPFAAGAKGLSFSREV